MRREGPQLCIKGGASLKKGKLEMGASNDGNLALTESLAPSESPKISLRLPERENAVLLQKPQCHRGHEIEIIRRLTVCSK